MPSASLRTALVLWLLAPLVGLWLVGSLAALAVIRHVTQTHYDEELKDTAQSLNVFVRLEEGRLAMTANETEQRALLFDAVDEEVFAVTDTEGRVVAGPADLPRPPAVPVVDIPLYFDAPYRGNAMRWVALAARHPSGAATTGGQWALILVGETRRKREAATREAALYVALPQLVLVAALAALVWYGVGRGLRPMQELHRRLQERSVADLEPIDIGRVPNEIRAVTEALNRLLARLAAAIEQQSTFIGDAAHQLRTPLAALRASVEYMQRTRDAGNRPDAMQRVVETADRCVRVVNQLLALARVDVARAGSTELQDTDVVSICEETVAASVDAALAARIDLGFETDAPRHVIRAEATLLREALRNLIDNAIRYTPAGGRVTASVEARGRMLRIAVTDNGPGIAVQDRERVFERFQRGEAAPGTGSGLGLPIARLCARALGGDLTYFDPPGGRGAGFAIDLPLAT